MYVCTCACVRAHMVTHGTRGQFVQVSSLLQPCGLQRLTSDHQTWQQAPLSAEPSHWPFLYVLIPFSVQVLRNVMPISDSLTKIHLTLPKHSPPPRPL